MAYGLSARLIRFAFLTVATAVLAYGTSGVAAAEPRSIAFLGVEFMNDNEMYEPTTDAERGRMAKIEEIFKTQLTESGRFRFVEVHDNVKARIAAGQRVGSCGGCEMDYGKELGSQLVAWIEVQKISNLILNANIYMADVAAEKMIFVKSADMRNNTDESWARSVTYIVKNYLLPDAAF